MKSEECKMSVNLSKAAKEFLLYSYFGITAEDLKDKDEIITICAQRAYLDLSRTLTFKPEFKDVKENNKVLKDRSENRKDFRDNMCKVIKGDVLKLIQSSSIAHDVNHKELCEKIKEKSGEAIDGEMTYGQAQKWLNMTIKYMWLLGIWDSDFNKIIGKIHIPVDSYIIEAVWEYESVDLPLKEKANRKYHYTNPSEHVKAWSQWDEDDYTKFQRSLGEYMYSKKQSPIEWEGPAWIEIAQKRNK